MKIHKDDKDDKMKSDSFDIITDEEDEYNNEYLNENGLEINLPADHKIEKTDDEYKFYFKSDLNSIRKKSEDKNEDEVDLENFYEQRQTLIEQQIVNRSSRSSLMTYNNNVKDSARISLSQAPRYSDSNNSQGASKSLSRNMSKQNSKINFSRNNSKSELKVENKINQNKISYDQFKKSNSARNINISTNNAKLKKSSSFINNPNEIKVLKLKITKDSIEDITNINQKYKKEKEKEKNLQKMSTDKRSTLNLSIKTSANTLLNTFRTNKSTKTNFPNEKMKSMRVSATQPVVVTSNLMTEDKKEEEVLSKELIENFLLNEEMSQKNNYLNTDEDKRSSILGKQLFKRTIKSEDKKFNTLIESTSSKDIKVKISQENVTKGQHDENLTEDIKSIYVKRRATKSICDMNIIENNTKKRFEEMYLRNMKWKKSVNQKSLQLKELFETEEMKKCSFSPKLNTNNSRILSKSMNEVGGKDFYSKNLKWKEGVENFIKNQHLVNERKQYEECVFQPVINKKIIKETIDTEYEKKGNDYIYQKNMKWLKKVKEDKQIKNLEMIEEMKQKAKFTTIRERISISRSKTNRNSNVSMSFRDFKTEEDKLKKDLCVSTFRSPSNLLSSINEVNSGIMQENEKEKIDRDIRELKNMILSLKSTLDENKILMSISDEFKYNDKEGEKSNVRSKSLQVSKSASSKNVKFLNNF